MNERYEDVFGLIKCIFNVGKLHENQIRLIKTFVGAKNINFNVPTGYGKSSIENKSLAILHIIALYCHDWNAG